MKDWKVYVVIAFSFILGWEWSAYIAYKDVSQIGTHLNCNNRGIHNEHTGNVPVEK